MSRFEALPIKPAEKPVVIRRKKGESLSRKREESELSYLPTQYVYDYYFKGERNDEGREVAKERERRNGMEDMRRFVGHGNFTKEKVDDDINKAKEARSQFERDPMFRDDKESELLEFLMTNNKFGFLGEANPQSTTLFDDYINHTDAIAQMSAEDIGQEMGIYFGIDFTVSNNPMVLENKTNKIGKEIFNSTGTTIEYFQDQRTGERTSLNQIPRAIIAFNRKGLSELCKLVRDNIEKNIPISPETIKYFQRAVLEDIKEQFSMQLDCFEKKSDTRRGILECTSKRFGRNRAIGETYMSNFENNLRQAIEVVDQIISKITQETHKDGHKESVSENVIKVSLTTDYKRIIREKFMGLYNATDR